MTKENTQNSRDTSDENKRKQHQGQCINTNANTTAQNSQKCF